jgi:hypothetical protein
VILTLHFFFLGLKAHIGQVEYFFILLCNLDFRPNSYLDRYAGSAALTLKHIVRSHLNLIFEKKQHPPCRTRTFRGMSSLNCNHTRKERYDLTWNVFERLFFFP